MGQSRDELLSIIKPAVVGWIDEVLTTSPAVSSQIFVSSGGATPSGPAGGDLAGSYPNPSVDGLQGRAVDPTAPGTGQVYRWTGSLWLPGNISDLAGTITDAQHGARGGGGLHAAATTGSAGFATLAPNGGTSAGTVVQANDGRLSDARAPTGPAGGDLAGSYPNPSVDGLQGRAVAATAPSTGQVLGWNGSAWAPQSMSAVRGQSLILRRAANQTINASSVANIAWDTEDLDEGGWWTTSDGATVPLPVGWYLVTALWGGVLQVASTGANNSLQVVVFPDGVNSRSGGTMRRFIPNGNAQAEMIITTVVQITAAGGFIRISATNGTGNNYTFAAATADSAEAKLIVRALGQ